MFVEIVEIGVGLASLVFGHGYGEHADHKTCRAHQVWVDFRIERIACLADLHIHANHSCQ